jgi:Fur family ferric uptake transcriptional regulator
MDVNISGLLRKAGQRPTPQRIMILSVLVESGTHMTAEAVYALVRRTYPHINLSTVYRTLEMLRDHRVISETDLGGGARQFELLRHPHHHLICLQCGHIIEMGAGALIPLREHLLDAYGFRARLDHFAIFGHCQACATHEHGEHP